MISDIIKNSMKYKCINKCFVEDSIIMKPGDIVVIEGDKLFNVTTGVDYRNIPDMDKLKVYLETITNEITVPQVSPVCTDIDRFEAITKKMLDTFKFKNHDYGNSFEQSLDEFGLIASAVRIGDKMNRFKSLLNKAAKVKDESLKDTLLDLATYSIMTVIWLDKHGGI